MGDRRLHNVGLIVNGAHHVGARTQRPMRTARIGTRRAIDMEHPRV
jgi:hypothetical protein